MQAILRQAVKLLAAALAAAAPGCGPEATHPAAVGHYLHSPESVSRLNRVVFIELADRSGHPQFAQTMTEAVCRAVREKKLFHVDVLRQSEPVCRLLPLEKRDAYSFRELMEMRQRLNCDAVLFGCVDSFQPYPHMQTGVYLRLLDLSRGELVWGVDHVWDTGRRGTERRIRDFYYASAPSGQEPAQWHLVLMSPRAFGRFVAFEIAQTLPQRPAAEPMDDRVRRGKRERTVQKVREKLEDL